MEHFESTELPLTMEGVFEDDQETISDLTTLSSSQFTSFEEPTQSAGRESPVVFENPTPEDGSVTSTSSSPSLWQVRPTLRRSWIWQYGMNEYLIFVI